MAFPDRPPPPQFALVSQSGSSSPRPSQTRLDRSTRPDPRVFGHIPGAPPGSRWEKRIDVSQAGVHAPVQSGISGTEDRGGAESVVLNDGYHDGDCGDIIWYMGSGGFVLDGHKKSIMQKDQDPESNTNRALRASLVNRRPVRVVRGSDAQHSPWAPESGYRYDGLYQVTRFDIVRDPSGLTDYRCLLFRMERLERDRYALPIKWDMHGRAHTKANEGRDRQRAEDAGLNTPNNLLERSKVRRPRESTASQSRPTSAPHPPPLPPRQSLPTPSHQRPPLQDLANRNRPANPPPAATAAQLGFLQSSITREALGKIKFTRKPAAPAAGSSERPPSPPAIQTQLPAPARPPSPRVPSAAIPTTPASLKTGPTSAPARAASPPKSRPAASPAARPLERTAPINPPARAASPPSSHTAAHPPARAASPPRSHKAANPPPARLSAKSPPPRLLQRSPPPTSRSSNQPGSRSSHHEHSRPLALPHKSSIRPRSPSPPPNRRTYPASSAYPYPRPTRPSSSYRPPPGPSPPQRPVNPRSRSRSPAQRPPEPHSAPRRPANIRPVSPPRPSSRPSPPRSAYTRPRSPSPCNLSPRVSLPCSPARASRSPPVKSAPPSKNSFGAGPRSGEVISPLDQFFPSRCRIPRSNPLTQAHARSDSDHPKGNETARSSGMSFNLSTSSSREVVLSPLPCDDFITQPDDHQSSQPCRPDPADTPARLSSPMSLDSDLPAPGSAGSQHSAGPTAIHSPGAGAKTVSEPKVTSAALFKPATPASLLSKFKDLPSEEDHDGVSIEPDVDELEDVKPDLVAILDPQPASAPDKEKESALEDPDLDGIHVDILVLSGDAVMVDSFQESQAEAGPDESERASVKCEIIEHEMAEGPVQTDGQEESLRSASPPASSGPGSLLDDRLSDPGTADTTRADLAPADGGEEFDVILTDYRGWLGDDWAGEERSKDPFHSFPVYHNALSQACSLQNSLAMSTILID
ncbi:hypothetical protein PtB15_2B580 [Puccinia triticina]|nr:hypothetical protein PtB15_2B580 [Puccinia triticina]